MYYIEFALFVKNYYNLLKMLRLGFSHRHSRQKGRRNRGGDLNPALVPGVVEGDGPGMQGQTGKTSPLAVFIITQDRVPEVLHMDPQLVSAPGLRR